MTRVSISEKISMSTNQSCGDDCLAGLHLMITRLCLQILFFSVWWASYITPPFIRRAFEYLFVSCFDTSNGTTACPKMLPLHTEEAPYHYA